MNLDELIAAERAEPRESTQAEADAVWKNLERSLIVVVPPVPPGGGGGGTAVLAKKTSLLAKLGSAVSTAAGKAVVTTTLITGVAVGTATVVDSSESTERVAAAPALDTPQNVANDNRPPHDKGGDEAPVFEQPVFEQPAPDVEPVLDQPAPDSTLVPVVVLDETSTPPSKPHRSVAPKRQRSRDADPPSKGASKPEVSAAAKLSAELAVIREAQGALRKGDYRKTLEALQRHQKDFSGGSMIQDREALRTIALCRSGDARGKAAASSFRLRWSKSLFLPRIEKACGS